MLKISYDKIKDESDRFEQFTNLTLEEFDMLLKEVEKVNSLFKKRRCKLMLKDQLLMYLMFLNLELNSDMLGNYFGINTRAVNNIINKMYNLIYITNKFVLESVLPKSDFTEKLDELVWKSSVQDNFNTAKREKLLIG